MSVICIIDGARRARCLCWRSFIDLVTVSATDVVDVVVFAPVLVLVVLVDTTGKGDLVSVSCGMATKEYPPHRPLPRKFS